jgi:hypothetical protein
MKFSAFIALFLFMFKFADELRSTATDITSWKILLYPKPAVDTDTLHLLAHHNATRASESSMAYLHVNL